jgi:mannose-1-phosphate guanylyltransferase
MVRDYPWSRIAPALGRRKADQFQAPESPTVWGVILAGSFDARTWPEWSEGVPTFLAAKDDAPGTLGRLLGFLSESIPTERILIACTPAHVVPIARMYLGIPEENFLVEPLPRGSGPVLALATARVARLDPNSVIVSLPIEHGLASEQGFSRSFQVGVEAARIGSIASAGLPLDHLDSEYGYIEGSSTIALTYGDHSAFQVNRFLSSEQFSEVAVEDSVVPVYRNAGIYYWRVDVLEDGLSRWQPRLRALAARLSREWKSRDWDRYDFERVSYNSWSALPTSSMERDVLQRMEHVVVVPIV